MSITLTQLRSFLAVVRGGSVTAAADELVVTQPSMSAAVTALSRELGVDLLERDGRGVRPTPAGREFAAYAADVIGLLEQGRRAAPRPRAGAGASCDRRGHHRGRVVRAAAHARLRRHAPPDRPRLEVGNRDRVLAMVLGHDADLAIGGNRPATGASRRTRSSRTSSC